MKKVVLLLVIGLSLIPTSALALVTGIINTDSLGYTHYTFDDGINAMSWTDALGNTQFQFGDGTTGRAYTDSLGYIHYSFDGQNSNPTQNSQTRCSINYRNFSCLEESQYQTIYNQAAAGVPQAGVQFTPEQSTGLSVLFGRPVTSISQEDRENMIMNGVYGDQLRNCRNSLDLYKTIKADYDKCIQDENAQKLKYIQQNFELRQQRANMIMNYQKDIICIKLGGLGFDQNTKQCKCQEGYSFDTKLTKCITTYQQPQTDSSQKTDANNSSTCPVNSTQNINGTCACNANFVVDKTKTKCVRCEDEDINSHYYTIKDDRYCACNDGYRMNQETRVCKRAVNNEPSTNAKIDFEAMAQKNGAKPINSNTTKKETDNKNTVTVKNQTNEDLIPVKSTTTVNFLENKDTQQSQQIPANRPTLKVRIINMFSGVKNFFSQMNFW